MDETPYAVFKNHLLTADMTRLFFQKPRMAEIWLILYIVSHLRSKWAECPKTNFQKLKVGGNVNIMDNDKSQSQNTVEPGKKNKTEVGNDDRSE